MSKAKEPKEKSSKKVPLKNLKEKRALKDAKRKEKSKIHEIHEMQIFMKCPELNDLSGSWYKLNLFRNQEYLNSVEGKYNTILLKYKIK